MAKDVGFSNVTVCAHPVDELTIVRRVCYAHQPGALNFSLLEGIRCHLPHANECAVILGVLADREQTDGRPPRMADEIDAVLVKLVTKPARQLIGIVELPAQRQTVFRIARVPRFARTALIPLHHHEFALERLLKAMREIHRRGAGTTVEEQDDRVVAVMSANQHPLLYAANHDWLEHRDAARNDSEPTVTDLMSPAAMQTEHRCEDEDNAEKCPCDEEQ